MTPLCFFRLDFPHQLPDPFPGLAHLEKDSAGYRWVPAPWNPVL